MSYGCSEVDCPCCGETVPDDQATDLVVADRPVSVCRSCYHYLTPTTAPTGGSNDE